MIHDRELIRRIEQLDLAVLREYVLAQARLFPDAAADVHANECATALHDATGLESRILGFDADRGGDTGDIDELAGWLAARALAAPAKITLDAAHVEPGQPPPKTVRFVLSPLAHPPHVAHLPKIGCAFRSASSVLTLDLDAARPEPSCPAVDIASVTVEQRPEAGEVILRGFLDGAEPSPTQRMVPTSYFEVEGMRHFMVYDDGELMGGAALVIRDDLALLTGMSILPQFRGRHLQSALIAHRLDVAKAAGARIALMTAASSGRSQRNAERAGFHVAYSQISLIAPAESLV